MAVHQLCRKAHRIRSHILKAALVHGPGALRRQLYLKSQGTPEGLPERHGLPKRENPGNSDNRRLFRFHSRKWIVLEQQLLPKRKQVGRLFFCRSLLLQLGPDLRVAGVAQNLSPLAAIVGNPVIPIGKTDNRSPAVVSAEGAGGIRLLGVRKCPHAFQTDEGALRPLFHVFLGQKGRPDGSHDSRVRRTGHFPPGVLLHGPEHRVVAEGASLNHDCFPQAVQVGDADYLGKYIFNNRAAKPRHNISRQLAVSLLRDNAAVHKYRAAASQHGRILRVKRLLGNPIHRNAEGGGKVFQERAAARRTRLIYQDIGDNSLVQPYGFHILPANVQDKCGVLYVFFHCPGMSHCLHHMVLGLKCLVEKKFPVSRGSCA